MKGIVRAEPPPCYPDQDVVAHAEKPYQREVRQRDDAGPIRYIAKQLRRLLRPVNVAFSETVGAATERDVQGNE